MCVLLLQTSVAQKTTERSVEECSASTDKLDQMVNIMADMAKQLEEVRDSCVVERYL